MERIWLRCLRVLPLRSYARIIGAVSRVPMPRLLRRPLFGWLARFFGMNLAEAEFPVGDYRCFQDLFARRLRQGTRPVDADAGVISPVDGCVSQYGVVDQGRLIQAKGVDYGLRELVVDPELAARLEGGTYLTIYLRPRDYHRIHCPADMRVRRMRRVPGTIYPVQPHVVRGMNGLFAKNERLVLDLEGDLGAAALVCVAATGVGNIPVAFPEADLEGPEPVAVGKGEEIAAFHLGSTVILLFGPGQVELEPLQTGQELRMGQPIARASVQEHAAGGPAAPATSDHPAHVGAGVAPQERLTGPAGRPA